MPGRQLPIYLQRAPPNIAQQARRVVVAAKERQEGQLTMQTWISRSQASQRIPSADPQDAGAISPHAWPALQLQRRLHDGVGIVWRERVINQRRSRRLHYDKARPRQRRRDVDQRRLIAIIANPRDDEDSLARAGNGWNSIHRLVHVEVGWTVRAGDCHLRVAHIPTADDKRPGCALMITDGSSIPAR